MEFETIKQNLIGKNYEKFAKKNFSFLAFLFGGLYYIHRKMYVEGIIFYLINIQLSNLTFYTGDTKFVFANLLFSISFALLFGGLYRTHLNKKANYLANKQPITDKDLKKHGKTNFGAVILVIIIVSIFQSNVINKHLYEPLFGNPILNTVKQVVNSIDGIDPNIVKALNQINSIDDLKNIESLLEQFNTTENFNSTSQDIIEDENEIESDEESNIVKDETSNTTAEDLNDEITNSIDETVVHKDTWTGTYSLDENTTITIHRSNIDSYEINLEHIDMTGEFSVNSASVTMKYVDNQTLKHIDFFDENNYVILSATDNGIIITETTYEEDSLWSKFLNTEFTKNEFENSNWNGIYKYNDYTIVLSETEKEYIHFYAHKDISTFAIGIDNYTDTELNYTDTFFDDTSVLKISKIENGIMVISSSTKENSLLNEISRNEFIKLEEQE